MISRQSCWCLAAFLGVGMVMCPDLSANTLWTENAESGLAFVIDNTSASYPLIQSDIVGEGDYAFHLANPIFADNSFVIDQTLSIQSDTKLFFLSQLGLASSVQVARVQVSTDDGASWPDNIYNQAGTSVSTNDPVEVEFSLREIDLGSYSGQEVRFRFYYDFSPGSALTLTTPGYGWYVDNIQIGDQFVSGVLGDYNGNDVIDAADYTTWRDALTAGATSLTNDPTPGTVDESDFLYWRAHFGETLGSGAGSAAASPSPAAVPEPATVFMAGSVLLLGLFSGVLRRPRV